MTKIYLHKNDLPADFDAGKAVDGCVAIDTETMGLLPGRDRLCLVQLSLGDDKAHLVQFGQDAYDAPNLKALLTNPDITKLFHFARFDVAVIKKYLDIDCAPIYCTKMASRLCRTYTDKHGLKELCDEILNVKLNKGQQSSDWGSSDLSQEQQNYAANDVLYLHKLKRELDIRLAREDRTDLARRVFEAIAVHADLDLGGWGEKSIFDH